MKSWIAVLLLTLVWTAPIAAQRTPSGYLKEMPDPARVLSSFDGDDRLDKTARQFGALSQLEKMVQDLSEGRFSKNQLTAEERRIWGGYNAALSRIETPHFDDAETRRLGLNSPLVKWSGLRGHYALDAAFRNELLDRFFSPAWKSSFLAVKARQDHERQAFTRRQQPLAPGRQATTALTAHSTPGTLPGRFADRVALLEGFKLITGGLLIFTLIAALRNESGPRHDADSRQALQLPDALRRINVFRKEYDVSCKSGKLYDKELWTETNITTTTSGGRAYQVGETVHSTPVTTSTHVRSTVHHRFWLRSTDGREFWWRVSGDALSATRGQVVSRIDSAGGHGLMMYNHSTGQFATHKSWFSDLHMLPTNQLFRIDLGAALAGFLALASLHRSAFETIWGWSLIGIVWVFAVFIVLAIPTSILNAIIRATRNRQFEKRVVPAFRRFLKESTPELLAHFPALPT